MTRFHAVKKRIFGVLETYVPVVARVHGAHHPEFHEVSRLFAEIKAKTEAAGQERPELAREFAQLRQITDNYTVPGDVCESYAAVYAMLSELDEAYHA
ncbi:MAG: iron-sulfur cluster repair di-iron protein, ric [Firmicutes bacterium]|nr:iron-sulfur cluster repair di-iron protein, ric [Bacillota bacterium]